MINVSYDNNPYDGKYDWQEWQRKDMDRIKYRQDQQNRTDDYNQQELMKQIRLQQKHVRDNWDKAISDLQKAKQREFNNRMKWNADPEKAGQMVDGMTDWLSDAVREDTVRRRQSAWNTKENINPDTIAYKTGFFLGMMLGNSEARKQVLGMIGQPLEHVMDVNRVNVAQNKVDQLKDTVNLPGLKIDAEAASHAWDTPSKEDAMAYANASRREILHGHTALTPETAAMEKMMMDQSAFEQMKDPENDLEHIVKMHSAVEKAIDQKIKVDHVPMDLVRKQQVRLLKETFEADPKQAFLYQETSNGVQFKDDKMLDNNGKEINNLSLRQPEDTMKYVEKSFKSFGEAMDKAKDDREDAYKWLDQQMKHYTAMAVFDGNDLNEDELAKAVTDSVIGSTAVHINLQMQKDFDKKNSKLLTKQAIAFTQKTVGYQNDDIKGAAKEFARDNRIKGIKLNDQVKALLDSHDYVQNVAGLTRTSAMDLAKSYSKSADQYLDEWLGDKGKKYSFTNYHPQINKESLKAFDPEYLSNVLPSYSSKAMQEKRDYVADPLTDPGQLMKKALKGKDNVHTKVVNRLRIALNEYDGLGHNRNYKANTQDKKLKNVHKAKTQAKSNKERKTKDKPERKSKQSKLNSEPKAEKVDNDPVFGLDNAEQDKTSKEELPSLEELNPTLAKNTKNMEAKKSGEELAK